MSKVREIDIWGWAIAGVLFIVVVVGLFLLGNHPALRSPSEYETKRYDNVIRVFMHDEQTVSFFVPGEDNELSHIVLDSNSRLAKVRYFADVPTGEPMWVEQVREIGSWRTDIEVHIHDESNVEGGSWKKQVSNGNVLNLGPRKFESGMVQVVE